MTSDQTKFLAQKLWDYLHVNHQVEKADCILVLGSNDKRVAERGARLFLDGYAPRLIYSGGLGALTKHIWTEPEADQFTNIAVSMGVPVDKILVENKSTNTGENIVFTKKLLEEKGLIMQKFIVVQKPYMERRAYATFKKVWPGKDLVVTSPRIPFDQYATKDIPMDYVINIMVGDLQRIKEYPKQGFQIEQAIPDDVWDAYNKLVRLGYTERLLK